MNRTTLMVLVPLFLTGCAVSRIEPLTVPLNYTPNPTNAGQVGALSCNVLSQVLVSDARTDKLLGVRTHESKPLTADVTAGSDPSIWVQNGLQSVLTQNGLTLQGKGPKLAVTIDSLRSTEDVWHRSSYAASIALTSRLETAAGKVCWQETTQGKGGNYGYSGSIENYQETLDSALDAAVVALAQLQGFKDGLCKCAD